MLVLMSLSILLNLYTVLEVNNNYIQKQNNYPIVSQMVLKLLAFGPAYFQSWRNLFDFILSVPTVAYAISGLIILLMPDSQNLYITVSF